MKNIVRLLFAFMIALESLPSAMGAPARSGSQTVVQPDGTSVTIVLHGDEWHHWITDTEGNLMVKDILGFYRQANEAEEADWQTAQQKSRPRKSAMRQTDDAGSHFSFPTAGRVRGLVVLVEYQDVHFTIDDPLTHYNNMMNQEGYHYAINDKYVHQGSAHDYFYQNSFGKFDPVFDVYGPIQLDNPREYYGENKGGNDKRPQEMVIEACAQLEKQGIDFSIYDNDKDGKIDLVFAIYAGEGENANGVSSSAVWPHAWSVISAGSGRHYYDNLLLDDYACTCELFDGYPDGVGTFCHEFSHVLGLPDTYDLSYVACAPYYYDVMDAGCYLRHGVCPANFSSYERYELGWLQPKLLSSTGSFTLHDFGTTNEAFIVPISSQTDDPRDGEYYLFENRQKTGWDSYLPGHGMLVWHIDYKASKWDGNSVNAWVNHQCIDLIEADGQKTKDNAYTQDDSTPFPGTASHTEFSDDTTPAFSGWSYPGQNNSELANRLNRSIFNIRETPDLAPDINLISFDFRNMNPPANGDVNGDGRVSVADIVQIINLIALEGNASAKGDVNGDGKTDAEDLHLLLGFLITEP